MIKKAVLLVAVFMMLFAFGVTMSSANEVGGMISATNVNSFPAGLVSSVNPGGLGDLLIYPYYNVRSNHLNLFNIINTDTVNGAKVRVVFRAAEDSREILDFSVCLSRGDVWTAYLIDDGNGGRIASLDTDTITAPAIPAAGQPFKPGGAVTYEDTKEGYFEVLPIAMIPGYDHNVAAANLVIADASECASWNSASDPVAHDPVGNVLMGNNTIIDLGSLEAFSSNATAIADANIVSVTDPGPGSELTLANTMFGGCDDADWILMKSAVITPFDLMAVIGGETEVILTFPTRRACHGGALTSMLFDGDQDAASGIQYCTTIGVEIWNDKEQSENVLAFSPKSDLCLPYEINVLKIGSGSNIWDSTVDFLIDSQGYDLGWLTVDLTGINHTVDYAGLGTHSADGLPVIAKTTQTFAKKASYMVDTAYKTMVNGLVFP